VSEPICHAYGATERVVNPLGIEPTLITYDLSSQGAKNSSGETASIPEGHSYHGFCSGRSEKTSSNSLRY
jgi:hypothetical protein